MIEVHRRNYVTTIGATVSALALAGCSTDSGDGNSGGSTEVTAEWNYKEYEKVRFPAQDEGVYFESDGEGQYVGTQFRITNETGESISLWYDIADLSFPEITLFADGNNEDVSTHAKSESELFENVDTGQTIEPTMLYIAPPDVSSYSVGTRDEANHTYSINRDENLEIQLVEVE